MNPNLKELMQKHGLHKHISEDCQHRMEMLYELIVRECINEVEGLQVSQSTLDWSQHWNRAIAHTALHLKEHFGVEE